MDVPTTSKESSEMNIFNVLNEDCLHLIIFDYLQLEHQVVLSQVCHRMREFILSIWKRKWSFANLINLSPNTGLKIAYVFFHAIANFCEEMMLNSFELLKYERVFRACNFSKLKCLDAHLLDDDIKADEQVFLISVLFPNLTKLKLSGRLLGNYIYRLKDLKELHLELGSKRICFIHIERFLKNVPLEKFTYNSAIKDGSPLREVSKCATLKELSTNCNFSRFDQIVETSFRNVRKITFTDRLSQSCSIQTLKALFFGTQIKRLVFVGFTKCQELSAYSGIEYMTDLSQLVLSDMNYLSSKQLTNIITQVPAKLTKFRYLKSLWNADVEDALLLLLNRCDNLKLLDISDTAASVKFLNKLLGGIEYNKQRDLMVYCFNTNILPNCLGEIYLPKNLKVSFEKQAICLPEFGSFQIVRK